MSIRLDILNLLGKLRDDEGLRRYFSDEIIVMYAGRMVEGGPSDEVIANPRHPCTRLLLEAAPDPGRGSGGGDPMWAEQERLGEPPSLINPPTGCRFHPRCPVAQDICRTNVPERTDHGDGHWSHCYAT